MIDNAIVGIVTALNLLMGYLGCHVSLNPVTGKSKPKWWIGAFVLLAVTSATLTILQAVRSGKEQGRLQEQLDKKLDNIQDNTAHPPTARAEIRMSRLE